MVEEAEPCHIVHRLERAHVRHWCGRALQEAPETRSHVLGGWVGCTWHTEESNALD